MDLSYNRQVSVLAADILLELHVLLQLQQPEFALHAVVALAHVSALTKEALLSPIISGYALLAILESAIHSI